MFGKNYTRWITGAGLALAMVGNLAGVGTASAQTLGITATALDSATPYQLTADSGSTLAAGSILTVSSSSFQADESVGFWINVPDGTVVSPDALGQDNTEIVNNVIGLNDMGSADSKGNLTYSVDTTGLPSGDYSLVAHGLSTGREAVLNFTITGGPAAGIATGSASAVPAGTILTISGVSFEANEPIGLWINVPDGTVISANSLGQDNSEVVDGVIGLDAMGAADDAGAFSYNLDTTGLPSGTYSLVAHGLNTGLNEVLIFTIS